LVSLNAAGITFSSAASGETRRQSPPGQSCHKHGTSDYVVGQVQAKLRSSRYLLAHPWFRPAANASEFGPYFGHCRPEFPAVATSGGIRLFI
jgi:hypothetical protein